MAQQEIYNFLKANNTVWFNTDQIANFLNMNKSQTCRAIRKIKKFPGIFDNIEEKYVREFRGNGFYSIKYYRLNVKLYKQ